MPQDPSDEDVADPVVSVGSEGHLYQSIAMDFEIAPVLVTLQPGPANNWAFVIRVVNGEKLKWMTVQSRRPPSVHHAQVMPSEHASYVKLGAYWNSGQPDTDAKSMTSHPRSEECVPLLEDCVDAIP